MRTVFLRVLSILTLITGGFLIAMGAHTWYVAQQGQQQAAREWATPADPPPAPLTKAEPKHRTGEVLGKLVIPRLNAHMFLVEGDGEKDLKRGPGHLTWSAEPGERGNCVIAGHRDTHFRVLKDIQSGDNIIIETRHAKYQYRVGGLSIVEPVNTASLDPSPEPILTLVTCYPFSYLGSAPKRFIVRAEMVGQSEPGRVLAKSLSGSRKASVRASVRRSASRPQSVRRASKIPMRSTAANRSATSSSPRSEPRQSASGLRKLNVFARLFRSGSSGSQTDSK